MTFWLPIIPVGIQIVPAVKHITPLGIENIPKCYCIEILTVSIQIAATIKAHSPG